MTMGYSKANVLISPFKTKGRPSWVAAGGVMWIIIHGTASGTAYPSSGTAHDFATTSGVSTHYVVGYDGVIYQCVDENDTAWGNGPISGPAGVAPTWGGNTGGAHDAWWDTVAKGDPNSCTISIEHSKSTDNTSTLSAVQQAASFALIADIYTRWGKYIPRAKATAKGGITGHFSMDPVNRSFCPGTYPITQLIAYLNNGNVPTSGGAGETSGGTGTTGETGTTTTGTTSTGSTGFSLGGISLPLTPGGTTSGGGQTFTPLLTQVHTTLVNAPGTLSVAQALDEAEQLPGWIDLSDNYTIGGGLMIPDPIGVTRSILATIAENATPIAIRVGVFGLGALLFMLLVVKAVMGNPPPPEFEDEEEFEG